MTSQSLLFYGGGGKGGVLPDFSTLERKIDTD